ncbi:hydrophilic protein [Amylostereum chailletii]|nr:hydrophilic protein [Amylostereum chailletii]
MSHISSNARPTTPPRGVPNPSALQLTPEQVKRVELNRLKAKARQREKEASSSISSVPNPNKKRALSIVPATSKSPTKQATRVAPGPSAAKLQRDSHLGKYFDYDLSKMVNSKGGFLVEEDHEDEDILRAKERERERQRAMQSIDPRRLPTYHRLVFTPSPYTAIFLDNNLNPKCAECGSIGIDHTYRKVFRCLVCNKCKNEKVEKYSLLTKTECKDDYLLTDSELRDEELLPHLLKANPHKSTFANMMLFCRFQVEEFAWKKWGSPEALDTEWERRIELKKKTKDKKFEQGLRELRKRTREGVWQKRQDAEHRHVFSQPHPDEDGIGHQVCHECGFTVEVEEL